MGNHSGHSGTLAIRGAVAGRPLALVVLMLGTNDFQSTHHNSAYQSAQGVAALVRAIRRAPIEPGMPCPAIMIVSPPPPGSATGAMKEKFDGARARAEGLTNAYREVATELNCHFFDAGAVASVSRVDGVHLDADQHQTLGRELSVPVGMLLSKP